jgi:outer membrane beta-barrel protein
MNRAATALVCAALAAAAPRAARASAADAFEHKVKPVSGQLYTKAGKLELTVPSLGLSFDDAFFSKYVAGAKLGYHVNEYVSLAVTGLLAATRPTGSTSVCPGNVACRPAKESELDLVPGQIRWIAGAELGFAPVYGKLNLFAEKAIHFDLSIFAGGDLVAFRDVVQRDANGAPVANAGKPGDATSPGAHLGIGTRIFLGRSTALRVEVRDIGYWVKNLGRGTFQTQLLAEVGLSFLLGGTSDAR